MARNSGVDVTSSPSTGLMRRPAQAQQRFGGRVVGNVLGKVGRKEACSGAWIPGRTFSPGAVGIGSHADS